MPIYSIIVNDINCIYDIITNEFDDEFNKLDEDNYADFKHYVIDHYISRLNNC